MGDPSIRITSRTDIRYGEVYKPILVTGPLAVRYWERIDAVKAQVDPLPFVPATWTMLSLLRSDTYSTGGWNANCLVAEEM